MHASATRVHCGFGGACAAQGAPSCITGARAIPSAARSSAAISSFFSGETLPVEFEGHRHHLLRGLAMHFLPGAGIVRAGGDLRALEDRDMEPRRCFRVAVEPEERGDALHESAPGVGAELHHGVTTIDGTCNRLRRTSAQADVARMFDPALSLRRGAWRRARRPVAAPAQRPGVR